MDFNLTEEQLMIQRMAKEFTEKEIEPRVVEMEREQKVVPGLIEKMAQVGLFGMLVPKEYGGTEAGALSLVLALEQIGHAGSGIFMLPLLNNGIPELIAHHGSEYLKEKYIRPICEGKVYAGVEFTEAETGSDPKMLVTTAMPDGDSYVINGAKRFISYGGRDGYAILWTKDETGNCTAFVVEKNTDGYTAEKQWELMGWPGWEAMDIYLENMRVPEANMLGKKGDGFRILLQSIAGEKAGYSATELGVAQAALDEAITYCKERIVRDRPIAQMQGHRWLLAEMYCKIEAARWMTYRTGFLWEQESPAFQTEAAATKLFVTSTAIDVARQALQLHGGYGYTKEFKVERLYRAAAGGPVIMVSHELNRSIVGASLIS